MAIQSAFLWPFIFLISALCLGSFVVLTVYSGNPNPSTMRAHSYANNMLIRGADGKLSSSIPADQYSLLVANQVPTLSQQKCFEGEYCNCPRYNGSYDQCTNNYPHKFSDFCECANRNFELCPFPFKSLEGKITPRRYIITEENFTTIPHQPLEPLFIDVPKTIEPPNKLPDCK